MIRFGCRLVDAVYRDQVSRLTAGARELLAHLDPPSALRRWMDLFGDWIATKNGMLDTLLAMVQSGEIAHQDRAARGHRRHPRSRPHQWRTARRRHRRGRRCRPHGIFTVAGSPEHHAMAARLLNLLMDGLRACACGRPKVAERE